jgi:uncharacterized protein (DUF697 family)/uncharacterized tellurite resistance protein B-like protein
VSVGPREALAGLRLLVAVARADERFDEVEQKVLRAAIAAIDPSALPPDFRESTLFDEPIDLDAELAVLARSPRRVDVYRSAFSVAWSDGERAPSERAILERARRALDIAPSVDRELGRLFEEPPRPDEAPAVSRVEDDDERRERAKKRTFELAVFAAVLGAFPLPGIAVATDLCVVALQIALFREIGGMWGERIPRDAARRLLAGMGVGTGARIAVANLAKLLPGWGSAFGAATAFATTWAVGVSSQRIHEASRNGEELGRDEVDDLFRASRAEGEERYAASRDVVDDRLREHGGLLTELADRLRAGDVTRSELEARVEQALATNLPTS